MLKQELDVEKAMEDLEWPEIEYEYAYYPSEKPSMYSPGDSESVDVYVADAEKTHQQIDAYLSQLKQKMMTQAINWAYSTEAEEAALAKIKED